MPWVEAGQTTQQGSSLLLDSPVPTITSTSTSTTAASLPTGDDQYNGDDDYGDDDWLVRVLVEIRYEDDQEEVLLVNGNHHE
jgi:hypothetical protein